MCYCKALDVHQLDYDDFLKIIFLRITCILTCSAWEGGAGDEGGWGAGGGDAIHVRNPALKPTCLTNNYLRPSGKRKGKYHD